MRFRPHVLRTLVMKDVARLLRNGPALMLLGLMVVVALLVGSSGIVEDTESEVVAAETARKEAWFVYQEKNSWVEHLERRAPQELGLRFLAASEAPTPYPANASVIELRSPLQDPGGFVRQHVRYHYPGSDPLSLIHI